MTTTLGLALPNCGFGRGGGDPLAHRDLLFALSDAAEEHGLDTVWVGDHVAFPLEPSAPYPYDDRPVLPSASAPIDPIATLCALAGRTQRVRLGFGVLVLPYRHPLVTAKLVTSLDVLSGGRVVLGVGTGWMPEEFAALGADFAARDDVCDETVQYLRACWTGTPSFEGAHFAIDGMTVLPRPVAPAGRIPVWVGGNGRRAMRRAARWGDGWNGLYAPPERFGALVDRLADACAGEGRDVSELTISLHGVMAPPPDDADGWERLASDLTRYERLGVAHAAVGIGRGHADGGVAAVAALARLAPVLAD